VFIDGALLVDQSQPTSSVSDFLLGQTVAGYNND
jgi:hypothetical protein